MRVLRGDTERVISNVRLAFQLLFRENVHSGFEVAELTFSRGWLLLVGQLWQLITMVLFDCHTSDRR